MTTEPTAGPRARTALGATLGVLCLVAAVLTVSSQTASAHHESPYTPSTEVSVCVDGPNLWEQMYLVDCSVAAPFESDDVCHHGPGGDTSCTGPTGVDSNTRCLYQFHQVTRPFDDSDPDVLFTVTEYEDGPCLARGDDTDPSDTCTSHASWSTGGSYWFFDVPCPPELTGEVVPYPVTVTLTGTAETVVPGEPVTLTFSVRDDHGEPLHGMPLTFSIQDSYGYGGSHEILSAGDQTEVTFTGLDHATRIVAWTPADDRYILDTFETTLAVQPVATLEVTKTRMRAGGLRHTLVGRVSVAESVTRVPVRLQRWTKGAWVSAVKQRTWSGRATFRDQRPGRYRLVAPAAQERLAAASSPVTAPRATTAPTMVG
jgi:hypothetical protein